MSEKKTLVDGRSINYSGYIDVEELMSQVHAFFKNYGYNMDELSNQEQVHENKKEILLKLTPSKKVSDYEKIEYFLYIHFSNLVPKEVEISGNTKHIYEGKASFSIDIYLKTDYEDRMQEQPILLFLRTLIEKFVHRGYISEVEKQAMKDGEAFAQEVKSFLNMHKNSIK